MAVSARVSGSVRASAVRGQRRDRSTKGAWGCDGRGAEGMREGGRDSRLPSVSFSRRSGKTRKAPVVTLGVGFPDAAANSPPLHDRAGLSC